MTRKPLLFAALLVGLPAASALAQPSATLQPQPELLEALIQCRAIPEAEAKLQCFEAATTALEQAVERREVVVVDRVQVRESRRRLFGVALPSLPIFGDDGEEEDEITSVEGVVASAFQSNNGRWVVRLEEGATWGQVDNSPLALRPRVGQPVVINRGALGSYMMQVNGQPGIRVRRQL